MWIKNDIKGNKQIWYSENEYQRLEKENAELKAYMDVNEYFKTAWEELKAENAKLKSCLQEIKGVVTSLYMNNWLQMNETARKSIQLLQDLITKAESEEV